MKYILLALALFLLPSCSRYVSWQQIDAAERLCEDNKGVESIEAGVSKTQVRTVCQNQARFWVEIKDVNN